jgi:hypothetical protein
MDREELMQLLREAREARLAGMDQVEIDGLINEFTGGQFVDTRALAAAAFAPPPEEAALARVAEHSPASQFARAFTQGLTFGFADELAGLGAAVVPGGKGFSEATEASRQRIEDIRETAPGAALASEIAGGFGVPFGALGTARGAIGAGATRAARAGRAAAAGAATGGATGALTGLGEGQGGLLARAPSAAVSGSLGAAAGGLLGGGVGAVSRTAPVSGQQIADRLVRRVGRQPGTIPATDAIDKSLKQVSREMFQPLEREFTEVTSPGVLAAIQSDDPLVNAVIRRSLPKAVRQGERPPSLLELQSLRQRLRGKASAAQRVGDPAERRLFSDAEAQLREALTDEIPGFAEAQSRWAALQASKRRGTRPLPPRGTYALA